MIDGILLYGKEEIFMETKEKKFPPIGQRIIKSALAVLITYLIYFLRGFDGIPFYTAIAAIQCIQPYKENTKKVSGNRVWGTVIGAFWGLFIVLVKIYILKNQHTLLLYILISVFIVVVMYTVIVFGKKTVAYFSCVVYLSIVMAHIGDAQPFLFAADRVIDTLIGVAIAAVISNFQFPRKKDCETLFVAGMDETLLGSDGTISDYSRVELNRMLDNGLKFTIATERTSASLLEGIGEIRLQMPVITFNGAVLFDIKKKEYLKVQEMSHSLVNEIRVFLADEAIGCYSTGLIQDTLMIYYNKFYSEVEEKIYHQLRSSLYRNYMRGDIHEEAKVFYMMSVGNDEKISNIYHRLREKEWFKELRVVRMRSTDYPGHTYLKIYHKDATKQNMIAELQKITQLEKVLTLGTIPDKYDRLIRDNDHNELVKTIKKYFEPFIWEKGR